MYNFTMLILIKNNNNNKFSDHFRSFTKRWSNFSDINCELRGKTIFDYVFFDNKHHIDIFIWNLHYSYEEQLY